MVGISLDFSSDSFSIADGRIFPFRPPTYWSAYDHGRLRDYLRVDPLHVEAWVEAANDAFATAIKDADYHRTNSAKLVKSLNHLSPAKQQRVHCLLSVHKILFSGKLCSYPKRKVHLELKPDAVPFHGKAYSVPIIHQETYRKELQRLVDIGVLARAYESEWAAPTFIIPKKDGTVRVVTDFRRLNQWIARKEFPLPRIPDLICRCSSYAYVTLLNVSMQYYTFVMEEESANLCTIVTLFGKYKYLCLPMGVNQSPDFSQAVMTELFESLSFVEAYLDDIAVFSNLFDEHVQHVGEVLRRLSDGGFTVKP